MTLEAAWKQKFIRHYKNDACVKILSLMRANCNGVPDLFVMLQNSPNARARSHASIFIECKRINEKGEKSSATEIQKHQHQELKKFGFFCVQAYSLKEATMIVEELKSEISTENEPLLPYFTT